MIADATHCVCGKPVPAAVLCHPHWSAIPSALKIAWSKAQDAGGEIAKRLTQAVWDYTQVTLSIDNLEHLATAAGRNKYRRDDLGKEIKHLENRRAEILDKWSEKEAA